MAPARTYKAPEGFVTLGEAQERLGISRVTMAALVRTGKIAAYADPVNGRVKLVKESDLERLRQPILPVTEGDEKKAAA